MTNHFALGYKAGLEAAVRELRLFTNAQCYADVIAALPIPDPTGSGLSIITDLGHGNYNVTASDGGLTTIRNDNGLFTITPANNQPMTLCTSTSCFQ